MRNAKMESRGVEKTEHSGGNKDVPETQRCLEN